MTDNDEEMDSASNNIPVLEDSVAENGAGDKALVSAKSATSKQQEDKPIRPKNFKPLTPEEEKLIKCCEEGKIDEVRAMLRNKKLKVDCLDDVSNR
jgi:hypothetical protein